MSTIPYTAKEIQTVSLATGVSPYKLKKWYAAGTIDVIEKDAVLDYLRRTQNAGDILVPREDAIFYLGNDEARLDAAIACGALLPTIDGMFYTSDFARLDPHTFAVLPPRPEYTPTRPKKNLPLKWFPNTPKKQEAYWRAFENRTAACEWWVADGKTFTIPDGCHCMSKLRLPKKVWRVNMEANAPLYASDVPADVNGKSTRIRVQGYSNTQGTVVNLSIMDDWGVWTYSHGTHPLQEKWGLALWRAVLALGLNVMQAADENAELRRLVRWLDTAAWA